MGCRREESERKRKPGRFECGNCGAVSKKKKHLCKPKKIKKAKSSGKGSS
ncbi:MAG: hypothetical protein HQ582_10085 [Planctomycetes bacterium]|nr:hypothetical protein [Planctomycetota bacterium]